MRREERVTVQGPVKEQQPDGMSHRGGGGGRDETAKNAMQINAFAPPPIKMVHVTQNFLKARLMQKTTQKKKAFAPLPLRWRHCHCVRGYAERCRRRDGGHKIAVLAGLSCAVGPSNRRRSPSNRRRLPSNRRPLPSHPRQRLASPCPALTPAPSPPAGARSSPGPPLPRPVHCSGPRRRTSTGSGATRC